LADFGAEVLKVERPGGDPARRMAPFLNDDVDPEKSLVFAYLNTNKQSVTLNLKSEKGIQVLKSLVEQSDVLVENFAPRVMASLGLDFETLQQINPGLVMTSISNFGQTGPYRDYKAADIVEYAMGGLMYISGGYDREPLKHAFNQAQFKAGTDAAAATLMATYHQRLTGEGQQVDVSIQEAVATGLRDVVNNFTYTGAVRRRQPNHSGDLSRIRASADGHLTPNPGIGAGLNWDVLVEFMELPELADDKFNTPSARLANAEELGHIFDDYFIKQNKYERFYAAHEKRFIFGVIQSPEEVMTDPQFEARNYFVDINHPVLGTLKYPGAPFEMSGTPWEARSPAPTLGQHNQEVIGQRLGHKPEEMAQMRATQII
jgi:crotonobetainyl-CoA:carnitine CoA-transferase CaiB-like acyl-CoA transferase